MPKIFVSYAQIDHQDGWVDVLVAKLRDAGFEVAHDASHLAIGTSIVHFMEREIESSQHILIVFSENYKRKATERIEGVGDEYELILSEVRKPRNNANKVIPILRSGSIETSIPLWFQGRHFIDMRDDDRFELQVQMLIDLCHGIKVNIQSLKEVALPVNNALFSQRTDLPVYVHTFDQHISPFALPENDTWQSKTRDGVYSLFNASGEKDVKFIHFNTQRMDLSGLDYMMDVRISNEAGADASCGILFSLNDTTRSYGLFGINAHGDCRVYKRDEKGLDVKDSKRTIHFNTGAFNELGLIRTSKHFHFKVNNVVMFSINSEVFSRGKIGLYALGNGTFSFANLKFYNTKY